MKRNPSGRLLCLLLSGILLLGCLSACAQPVEKPAKTLSAEVSVQAASVSAEDIRIMAAQRLQPGLGDLEWAKGTFPTPAGILSVSLKRNADGTTAVEYDAPKGIEVELA